MSSFLIDQELPRSTADILRSQGVRATHVGELEMATATDEEILEYARSNALVIVTHDADFHALLALSGRNAPSSPLTQSSIKNSQPEALFPPLKT